MSVIAVASYGRAGRVSSVNVFPRGVVVVPESQVAAYRKQKMPKGWKVQGIPDEQDGNLCRKRNAILDLFSGKDVLIVDDDYDYVGRWQGGIDMRLEGEDIDRLLDNGFRMARDLGTPLWGINVQVDRRFYREYTPISITNPVLGPWQAFTGDRPEWVRYDEDLWLKEDYDLSLRVLQRVHRILRLNAYHYRVDHFNEAGGQVGKRNMNEEIRQLHALQRRWGSDVVKLELHRSVNPILKVPLKGV